MKRYHPRGVVGGLAGSRNSRAITEAPRSQKLFAPDHSLTNRFGAVCRLGIKLHLNGFRIDVAEINLNMKKMPGFFSLDPDFAESQRGPMFFERFTQRL